LFGIDGVKGVFLGADFVTVTKAEGKNWAALKAPILAALMDHFTSGKPVLASADAAAQTTSDDPVVAQICELLDHKIRPAVAQDGGDITFDRYEDGVVYLHLKGSCAGCPSSTMTLKAGVENLLRHYIPEIREVRQAAR
jgi:Fe-S cluster biogenesis protein NfuA